MKRALAVSGAVFALTTSFVSAALAEETPAWFVPPEQCPTKPCTCDDIPMMEMFLANQEKAREAWQSVRDDLFTATGPQSTQDAVALFNSRFGGDPRIATQFQSCTGYDPAKNSLTKIAGVAGIGQAVLDPCFCDAFCADIVDATIDHELTHGPTIVIGVLNQANFRIACKAGILPDTFCNSLDPAVLVDSEIISYGIGNSSLRSSIEDLRASDPSKPEIACTWKPLPPSQKILPPAPAPSSFLERVRLLAHRFVHGAMD